MLLEVVRAQNSESKNTQNAQNEIIKLRTYYLIDSNGVGIFGFEF